MGYEEDRSIVVQDRVDTREDAIKNLPQRNNNPLNIKCYGSAKRFIESGEATKEGEWCRFIDSETGFRSAKWLIQNRYTTATVDQMLFRWSGGGYVFGDSRIINQLTEEELDDVIERMAIREGFYAK